MAKLGLNTSDADVKKLWEEKTFRETMKDSILAPFMGSGSSSMIQTREDFTKSKGDNVTFTLIPRLSGAGVTSNQALEGNEESLTRHTYSISLEEYAHAVRDAGPLDRQRAAWNVSEEQAEALRVWGAEKITLDQFDALKASPTQTFVPTNGNIYTSYATAKAVLTTADVITPAFVSRIKAWALGGGNRANDQSPLRPIRVDGEQMYVMFISLDAGYDLSRNAEFQQAEREARERSKSNPLFKRVKFVWDNVCIIPTEWITLGTDAGSGANVPFSHNLFCGAQALCHSWGKRPVIVTKKFDYDREHGVAWCMMYAVGKPSFNSRDYGVISAPTARTQINDVTFT